MFSRIMVYIRKIKSDYEYREKDFVVNEHNGDTNIEWNPNFEIPRPRINDLVGITALEIENFERKKICKTFIDVVDDLTLIDCPRPGAIVFCRDALFVFDGTWKQV